MSSKDWLLLITLSVLWGGSFLFFGIAIKELSPFTLVFSRVFIAALCLVVFARLPRKLYPGLPWKDFFTMALLNNVIPFTLIAWGQSHIASGLAAIINASTPLFTVLVAHFLTTDEKANGFKVAGIIMGILGVAIMIGSDATASLSLHVIAELAIVGAAISYSFASVFGRRFKTKGIDPVSSATGQVVASSIILLPIMLLIDQPWALPLPGAATTWSLLGLGILSTALAYLIFFRLLSSAGATNLMRVTLLVPVSAVWFGWWILDEQLSMTHFVGMGIIGLGLLLIDQRLFRR